MFLDLDGTLVDIAERPDDVIADDLLRGLIARLAVALDGRLAIVSGRSLAQLDAILGPVPETVALSGSHGSEHRWQGVSAHPIRSAALDEAARRLRAFTDARDGLLLEEKSYGVAVHYRMAPGAEREVHGVVSRLAGELGLSIQPGKMMIELRVPGGGKGVAVRGLMSRAPMADTRPVFIGDDATDEPAFAAAVALGGTGVLVGAPRPTFARYSLPDPASVKRWLEQAIA